MRTAQKEISRRREMNLRAMRGPASYLLAAVAFGALVFATVFYDRSITDDAVIFSYLRAPTITTIQ
jgi:hypothetical protein